MAELESRRRGRKWRNVDFWTSTEFWCSDMGFKTVNKQRDFESESGRGVPPPRYLGGCLLRSDSGARVRVAAGWAQWLSDRRSASGDRRRRCRPRGSVQRRGCSGCRVPRRARPGCRNSLHARALPLPAVREHTEFPGKFRTGTRFAFVFARGRIARSATEGTGP